ncbi:hypothetical protein LTR50_007356 [Elasticomyces elasticus]|nr:hypothetical protein LTR50_007356 [Elasticomyces elasticus]
MKFQSILIALSTLLRVGLAAYDAGPGLGISLSSGYATVSVRLENGTYIDIAKIEGGERYKAYMLGSQEEPSAVLVSTKYCPSSRHICQRYWPITTVVQPPNPLAPILQALVAAAESTLEKRIRSVAVSAYDLFTIDHDLVQRDVQSALNGVQVYSWHRIDHVVRQLVPALGIQGRCSDPYTLPDDPSYHADPEQLILTVEYTRQSLTAALWEEECSVLSQRGGVHTNELGHDALEACRRTNDSASCDEAFKSTLRDVLRSQESMSSTDQTIGAVLIMGEQANDDGMMTLLRQVLEEQCSNGESADLSLVRELAVDPAYVGSRVSALAEWEAKAIVRDEHQYPAAKDL